MTVKNIDYFSKLLSKIGANKSLYSVYLSEQLKDWEEEDIFRFIANCSVESMNFSLTRERMFYSTVNAINNAFGKTFRESGRNPEHYLRDSKKLGNFVYANKLGNGSEASGDGFKFRGGGLIQLTGKNNYRDFSNDTGIDILSNPDLVELPKYALAVSVWFWNKNNIKNKKTLLDVRKAVNGPKALGYDETVKIYNKLIS